MKILQMNKYWYLRGGAERYLFDVSELLERHGHEVIPFAMQDKRNDPTPWSRYFAPHRETERVQVNFEGLRTAANLIYSFEARRALADLLRATRPTLAHVHSVYHQLSPSVLDALRAARVPAVMTVHDYRLLSPNYSLFHDGVPCERGIKHPFAIVPHRCLKRSYAASMLAATETALTRARHTYERAISRFILPSQSAYAVFERAGWNMKRCVVIPHFLDTRAFTPAYGGNSAVFVGRLSQEKGADVFIEAARRLPQLLFRLIGAGPEEARLRALAAGLRNVHFEGWLSGSELHAAVSRAAVVVVPSMVQEVFGYAALEAMALGKPVIASRLGALPELIREQETGVLFTPGRSDELAVCLREVMSSQATLERMGRAGRARAEQDYAPERHFSRIIEIYSDALADHSLWIPNLRS